MVRAREDVAARGVRVPEEYSVNHAVILVDPAVRVKIDIKPPISASTTMLSSQDVQFNLSVVCSMCGSP